MHYLIKFAKMIDAINEWTGNVFRFIVILLMLLVSYEVIMRYILVRPSEWGQEINGFLLLGLIFLGGGYALLHDTHVKVEIFYKKFSKRTQAAIDLATSFFLFAICIVLIWKGGEVAWESFQKGVRIPSTWAPLMWPSQLLIPIGGALLGLQGIANWIRNLLVVLEFKIPEEL